MYLYNLYIFFKRIDSITYSKTKEMEKNSKKVIQKCSGEKNFFSQNVSFCVPQKQSLRQGFGCTSLVKRNVLRKRKSQHKEVFWGH